MRTFNYSEYEKRSWDTETVNYLTQIHEARGRQYALLASQHGWHEGADDPMPFIKYLLGIILAAYRDFDERMEIAGENASSTDIVRNAVSRQIGKFTKADIRKLCPSISQSGVERGLKAVCAAGEITRNGSGKATYYLRTR